MGVKSWFINLFPVLDRKKGTINLNDEYCRLSIEMYYKMLAIETAINLIANTIALSEFKTFDKGLEVKKDNYYLLNVQPNQNQNASRFWRKVIYNLVYNNEALSIMQNENIYVADEFTRKNYAFKENYYENIYIEDLSLNKKYSENEVFYFALHSTKMNGLINQIYEDYGKLIEYSKKTYKRSNARRGILEIPASYPQTPEAQANLQKLLTENFKNFFNTENGAVLPLSNGLTYNDLTNQTYKNGSDSRDIRSLIDDVFDYVAIAFQIPPQMLKGTIAESDKTWDNYMTFCIKPLTELLEKEINRKMYSKQEYLNRSHVKVDTSLIRPGWISELANAIDILTRNGVNTLDDNLQLLGREKVGGKLGETRFTTLNLTTMDAAIEGGDNQNEKREDRL